MVAALVGTASLVRTIGIARAPVVFVAAAAGACRRAATRRGLRTQVVQAASERHVREHGGKREHSDEANHACLRLKNAT